MDELRCRLDASGYGRIGFPEHYDRHRPRRTLVLMELRPGVAGEVALHSTEWGDGQRLVGFALGEGSTQTLLDAGATEEEIGLDRLRREAEGIPEPVPWWIGYRAWIGLK